MNSNYSICSASTTDWFNSIGTITTSDIPSRYFYEHGLTYDEVMSQVNDPELPIVSNEEWDKISNLLSSSDIELIKLGFQLLSGYRFPRGVINLTIINKAINNYLKNIN